jgi:1-acyl-sn-glycerol-3-phosphate acyltransferase
MMKSALMISFGVLAYAVFETGKIAVPTIWDGLRGNVDPRRCDRRLDSWSRKLLNQARVELEVSGLEHVTPDESYVVMSNHQSHYDIPVIFQALKIPVRMVAKQELFRIPVMGAGMRASGFVELNRQNRSQALKTLNEAWPRLRRDGLSIWIAPEGTRSPDGGLGAFKRGGFRLAAESGMRILPVTIDGSIAVHRAQTSTVQKGQVVRVSVSPPVDPRDFKNGKGKALVEKVEAAIRSKLGSGG